MSERNLAGCILPRLRPALVEGRHMWPLFFFSACRFSLIQHLSIDLLMFCSAFSPVHHSLVRLAHLLCSISCLLAGSFSSSVVPCLSLALAHPYSFLASLDVLLSQLAGVSSFFLVFRLLNFVLFSKLSRAHCISSSPPIFNAKLVRAVTKASPMWQPMRFHTGDPDEDQEVSSIVSELINAAPRFEPC